jgi:Fe-S-cluster containining protein
MIGMGGIRKVQKSPRDKRLQLKAYAVESFIPIPSLRDPESQRLSALMTSLAAAMAATKEIETFAMTGWLPDSFFTLLAEFYATYDSFITHNISTSKLKIMCKTGCSRCCHQAVHGCYSFEVINLYRHLRALPDYPQIHNRAVKHADEFQMLLLKIQQNPPNANSTHQNALTLALRSFAAAAKPCPLLVDDKCIVYEDRPAPCRMYHSLTDPIICVTPIGRTFNLEIPEPANKTLWELNERLAFPFSNFLSQGLVSFAFRRQFQPWSVPTGTKASH